MTNIRTQLLYLPAHHTTPPVEPVSLHTFDHPVFGIAEVEPDVFMVNDPHLRRRLLCRRQRRFRPAESEDNVLWPMITAAAPEISGSLTQLSSEHDELDAALDKLESIPLHDDGDRAALRDAAVVVRDVIHQHLEHEEPLLFPALRARDTAAVDRVLPARDRDVTPGGCTPAARPQRRGRHPGGGGIGPRRSAGAGEGVRSVLREQGHAGLRALRDAA